MLLKYCNIILKEKKALPLTNLLKTIYKSFKKFIIETKAEKSVTRVQTPDYLGFRFQFQIQKSFKANSDSVPINQNLLTPSIMTNFDHEPQTKP